MSWARVLGVLRGVGSREFAVWRDFFRDRWVTVVGEYVSVRKRVRRGCPQGSISGPFLWNLVMNELLEELDTAGVLCCAYADDLLLLIEGNSRRMIEERASIACETVHAWGQWVGVDMSHEKSNCMLLKGILAGNRPPWVRVAGRVLPYRDTVTYLGLRVGERLSFRPHLVYLKDKVMAVAGMLRRVLRCEWGLRRKAMRTVYAGVLEAGVMYGASVWAVCLQFAYARVSLLRIQRVALLACLRVCRTVSTGALQVLAGAYPWDLVAAGRRVRYVQARVEVMSEWEARGVLELVRPNEKPSKAELRRKVMDVWQSRWDNCEKGRVTYGFVSRVDAVPQTAWFDVGWGMGFLLTGHGSLNDFLYRRGLSETDRCRCGGVEDSGHVLFECRIYEDLRVWERPGHELYGRLTPGNRGLVSEDRAAFQAVSDFAKAAFARRLELP